jgi:hypothetical protein
VRRQRQVPLVVAGVLLVLGCALAFADASLQMGGHEQVLVLSQPLGAGQVLTAGDLRAAQLSAGSGVDVVPVSEEPTVLGRPAAVPLVAGALLTTSELGPAAPVGRGSDVVAVGLKPGAYPPELVPGEHVEVVAVGSPTGATAPAPARAGEVAATLLAVQGAPAASGGPTVFSLQVPGAYAVEVASLAAQGDASLVLVGG